MKRGDIYWYEHPEAGRRPWLILTRSEAIPVLNQVLAVPATRTIRLIPIEVPLDEGDGMPCPSIRPEGTGGFSRQGNRGSGRKPDISVGCHSSPV